MFFVKLSFQEWTQQVQDMLNTKKFGDIAFRDKDFKNAIEYYSKVCSHILFVEKSRKHLKNFHLKITATEAISQHLFFLL